jgi:hypothetical protein
MTVRIDNLVSRWTQTSADNIAFAITVLDDGGANTLRSKFFNFSYASENRIVGYANGQISSNTLATRQEINVNSGAIVLYPNGFIATAQADVNVNSGAVVLYSNGQFSVNNGTTVIYANGTISVNRGQIVAFANGMIVANNNMFITGNINVSGIVVSSNGDITTPVRVIANLAYDKANTTNLIADRANTIANLAFDRANIANTITFQANGTIKTSNRTKVNFINTSAILITLVDDAAGDRTNVTISLSANTVNLQYINATGVWTKPTGAQPTWKARIQIWAGGASGSVGTGGGGGGGGAYNETTVHLYQLLSTESVVIGLGGASQTGSGPGNVGGNTTFGNTILLSAYGGGTGNTCIANGCYGGGGGGLLGPGANGAQNGIGGDGGGGNGGVGDKIISGMNLTGALPGIPADASHWGGGGGGYGTASGVRNGGRGGDSVFGGAGGGGVCGGGTDGVGGKSAYGGNGGDANGSPPDGQFPGGGGGATSGTTDSGAGANGQCIVTVTSS